MRNRKGITLVELIVVIFVIFTILFLALSFWPNPRRKYLVMRLVCGTNLKDMANALNVYAFDYDDKYPVQGAGTHSWGKTTTNWDDPLKDWENSDGTVTVASSLYLLVREADVGVKSFVCMGSDQTPFVNETGNDTLDLWDFGANPTEHQSYSYQYPYGKFPSHGKSPAGNAIMADRNPWFDEILSASSIEKETMKTFSNKVSLIDFRGEANQWNQQIGNSSAHTQDDKKGRRQGQNVLFGDGHVTFERRPDVGVKYDNIYTIGGDTEEDRRVGTAPTGKSIDSVNSEDSLLVNDR